MGIVIFFGFGLGALQVNDAIRVKAAIAFGLTAGAIWLACFLFEKSNQQPSTRTGRQ